jgi:hypothetical protein
MLDEIQAATLNAEINAPNTPPSRQVARNIPSR